jgi:hypothetical protein
MANATKPKEAKKPKLTAREERLHKLLIENAESPSPRPMCDLMIEAGYARSTALADAGIYVSKIREKTGMADAMDKVGLNNEFLMQKLKDGLDCTKVISAVGGTDAGAGTMDFIDVPDHTNRKGYLDQALKIKGAYAADKTDINLNGPIKINIMQYGEEDKE